MHGLIGPKVFKEKVMNIRKSGTDRSENTKDEGVLEKIAKVIDPPSREVSDAELIDPGTNTPATKPDHPSGIPASGSKQRQDGPNPSDKRSR